MSMKQFKVTYCFIVSEKFVCMSAKTSSSVKIMDGFEECCFAASVGTQDKCKLRRKLKRAELMRAHVLQRKILEGHTLSILDVLRDGFIEP